jgi:hypothetical protein
MAVETSAVQIVVNVTDANSGAVIAGVEQNISKLGAAGTTSGQQMRRGLEEAGAGALSAREKTRLLSEEFGIRIPRAMQSLIASSKTAQSVLGGLTTAVIGLGAIQIGAMVFEAAIAGAEKLWHNVLNVNQAVEDYQAEVAKAKLEDFGNTQSIETTKLRINEATEAVKRYEAEVASQQQKAQFWTLPGLEAVPGLSLGMGLYHDKKAHDAQGSATDMQRQLDKLKKDQLAAQKHELTLLAIQRDHPDQLGRKLAENQENYAYDRAREGVHGNDVANDAGAQKKAIEDQIARQEAAAQGGKGGKGGAGDAKSQAQELARIHEEALESGLRGSELYHAQEAAAIDDLKRRGIASAQAVEDVHAKFHNQEMNRLRAQQDETEKLGRAAAMAGMTGIQKTQAEGAGKIADINVDENLDPAERAKRIGYAQQETNQQIGEEQRTFTQEINALADSSAEHQVQGFARIHAEGAKELDRLQKDFDKSYALMDRHAPGGEDQYQQGVSQLQRGQGLIASGESGQATELARKNEQETEQIEAQARIKFFDAEKQKTQAIKTELDERLQKYKEEKDNEGLSQDNYNRRVAAAQQEANAQMIQAATEARQKMAGEFTHLFSSMDHPLKALAEMGDKAAGEAAASLFQRFQGHNTSTGGTPMKDIPTNSLNSVIGGFGFHVGGHKPGAAPGLGEPGSAVPASAHAPGSGAEKTIAVSQAIIHIASATFAGGPATGAGAASMGSGAPGATSAPGVSSPASGSYSAAPRSTSTIAASSISASSSAPEYGASLPASGSFSSGTGVGYGSTPAAIAAGSNGGTGAAAGSSSSAATGGAGRGGGAEGIANFAAGSGSAPIKGTPVGTALGEVNEGIGLTKQLKSSWMKKGTESSPVFHPKIFGQEIKAGFSRHPKNSADAGTGAISGTDQDAGSLATSSPGSTAAAGTGSSSDSWTMPSTSSTPIVPGAGTASSSANMSSNTTPSASFANGVSSDVGSVPGSLKNAQGNDSTMQGAMTAGQGAVGMYSAVEGNGGAGGALKGAAAGAEIGSLFGPIGMAVGAAAGAIIGAIGIGGREKARVYDLTTVRPRLANDRDSFQQGSMDYLSAYSDAESLQTEAYKTCSKLGPAAGHYYSDTIKPEIIAAEGKLTAEQRAGRSQYTTSAASYDVGSDYIPQTGWNLNHVGERIIPSDQNERITQAIEGGGKMPVQAAAMGDVHLHVHAIDAKGVAGFLDKYKHNIRGAVNDSYAENSGGGL